ncbi:hypothetical protein [Pseudarthrobacter equi]|uniref:hypothetical protein n=1 Tax=Pseudarthrobacter equi TaxID=728066 RepID=UPI0021C165D5|nr:hypothetical protein [Pseudarthrobacter equi]
MTSSTASGLATGRTRIVGVLAVSRDEEFNWRAFKSAARELSKHGYGLALFDLNDFGNSAELFLSATSVEKRCDGLLVLGGTLKDEQSTLLGLAQLPVVTAAGRTSHTCVDETSVTVEAVDHLLNQMNTVTR